MGNSTSGKIAPNLDSNFYRDSWMINVSMYGLLGLLVVYALSMEMKDVRCPTPYSTNEECEIGGGMSFAWSRPDPNDSCGTLLDKIDKAAGYEVNSVKWRRHFLFSVAIMLVAWLLINGRLPNWHIFYLYLIVSFIILTAFGMYYSYHVYRRAEGWIFDSTDLIREKYCNVPVTANPRVRSGREFHNLPS